ncbi:MAG: deoxyribose-phosphate aldolase [Saprospiraceae bacterium]|nr:deoxyribose-phosphate aldolase [Saprospiraceae bacterium]
MDIRKTIEHTILRPDCTTDAVHQLCEDALQHTFYGVCMPPYFVRDAVRFINERAKVITVVGFPMGYSTIPSKVEEIKKALDEGADEVDAVVSIAAIKSGNWNYVKNELDSMMRSVSLKGKILKLIVETALLTREELAKLLPIAEQNEVHFIKTSTGFNGTGAMVEDVRFLKASLQGKTKIKASGGIKTQEQAEKLLKAGADRIGTSSGLHMLEI